MERTQCRNLRGAGVRSKDTGGMSHEQVAKTLGWPRSTVQQIEARALKKLRLGADSIEKVDSAQLDRLHIIVDLMLASGWR